MGWVGGGVNRGEYLLTLAGLEGGGWRCGGLRCGVQLVDWSLGMELLTDHLNQILCNLQCVFENNTSGSAGLNRLFLGIAARVVTATMRP